MPNIRIEFEYDEPNEWYTNDFSEGKKGTFVYEGPEYLTIEIDKETGEELGWCLMSPEEHERPVAQDCMRMTIDCKDNPLVCEIVNDQGKDSDRDFYETRPWVHKCKAPEGYNDVDIPAVLHPRDIYDEFHVKFDFETQEFILPVKTWTTIEKIDPSKVTWAHFRAKRDQLLASTDGQTDPNMPEHMIAAWEEYRQLLRDAPDALAEFGPFYAAQMLPDEPDFATETADNAFDNLPPITVDGGDIDPEQATI
jgi:hypothetical protein